MAVGASANSQTSRQAWLDLVNNRCFNLGVRYCGQLCVPTGSGDSVKSGRTLGLLISVCLCRNFYGVAIEGQENSEL